MVLNCYPFGSPPTLPADAGEPEGSTRVTNGSAGGHQFNTIGEGKRMWMRKGLTMERYVVRDRGVGKKM